MIARIGVIGPFGMLLAGLAVLVFVSTLLLGWQIADEPDPAANRIFASETLQDDTPRADLAGTVSDVDGEIISVRVGEDLVRVRVGAGAVIQRLSPITPADVAAGDWIILGGIDDNVHTLILQAAIVAGPDEVVGPAGGAP